MSTLMFCVLLVVMCGLCMYVGYVYGRHALPPLQTPGELPNGIYNVVRAVPLLQGKETSFLTVLRSPRCKTSYVVRFREEITMPFEVTSGVVRFLNETATEHVVTLRPRVDKVG